ncbi:MAG: methyltransferase domain-containing protein [Desulfotignum sp.]
MGKYDYALDLDFKNSLSLIAGRVKKNSRVLEFGPANGRLTRHLKQMLNCDVTIVEIDEASGRDAAAYASLSLLGREQGDIESYVWYDQLEEQRFDHIIFADVLEHLHDPETVLLKSSKRLAENGSVLISIPNIAHNSVIIDLMNNRFQYGDIGLLDNTHLKFFTYYSFVELLNRTGLFTVGEFCACARVGETEFQNSYNDVNPAVAKVLRKKEFGNVYQFVFEVKPKQNDSTLESNIYRNLDKTASYQSALYIDDGTGFKETRKITRFIDPDENTREFELTPFDTARRIRFDPIDTNCIIRINNLEFLDENKISRSVSISAHNAEYVSDNILCYECDDPYMIVDVTGPVHTFRVDYEFIDYDFTGSGGMAFLFDQIKKTAEVRHELQQMQASRSWRYTRIFRREPGQ